MGLSTQIADDRSVSGVDRLERLRAELEQHFPHVSGALPEKIAVLLPCYNEEAAVAGVVQGFREALPEAQVYVYDNNSTDATIEKAQDAGAIVRTETLQGKGNVVRRMFADIDADIYILADGDGTYDPKLARSLIEKLTQENLDMVVGARLGEEGAYRSGHVFGNKLFNRIVRHLYGPGFSDILSGYRAFSRRFAKSFPASSSGFEIETELSVHALDLRIATGEIPMRYSARPEGSFSKLNTFRDGARILWTIAMLYRELRPFRFFSSMALAFLVFGAFLGFPVAQTYFQTGLVPQLPSAIAAMGCVQLSVFCTICGVILESVSESRREMKRMRYLDLRAVTSKS